jgi:hypothetical protein
MDVGVVDEGIHESHACSTSADDQVVSLNQYSPVLKDGALGYGFMLQISHLAIPLVLRQYRR